MSEVLGVRVGDGIGRGDVGEKQGESTGESSKDGDLDTADLRRLL